MKNIHLLPTSQPSKIFYLASNLHLEKGQLITPKSYQNIYITSDEEIKEGDWCLDLRDNSIFKIKLPIDGVGLILKIILTTDVDLIKDGVQPIDDEFLEWFVKNPSCEKVKVEDYGNLYNFRYLILIPKEEPITLGKIIPKERVIGLKEPKQRLEKYSERFDNDKSPIGNPETWGKRIVKEPKQETIDEVAKKYQMENGGAYSMGLDDAFYDGAEWQRERSYSEEEVLNILQKYRFDFSLYRNIQVLPLEFSKWFEQFKKK